jgi:hypothetical protein
MFLKRQVLLGMGLALLGAVTLTGCPELNSAIVGDWKVESAGGISQEGTGINQTFEFRGNGDFETTTVVAGVAVRQGGAFSVNEGRTPSTLLLESHWIEANGARETFTQEEREFVRQNFIFEITEEGARLRLGTNLGTGNQGPPASFSDANLYEVICRRQ